MKQEGNALKASEKLWQNNQIITACHIKVFLYEMTLNEKWHCTLVPLFINYYGAEFD